MPSKIDTFVTSIDLTKTPDLGKAIKDECDIVATGKDQMRLAAAFEAHNRLILIFQTAADNKLPG